MPADTFRIRNDWDRQIVESVFANDEYQLRALGEAGLPVRWVLDVGSHIGAFTRLVKQLWPAASVIAVEPDPTAKPYWHFNTAGFDGLFWHEQAIVPMGGPRTVRLMHSLDQNAAANFTAEIVAEFTTVPTERSFDEVAAVDIVSLLSEHGNPDLDFVKLDCEGAEAHILEDLRMAQYLPRITHICGEWHYFESIERIESALRETHELKLFRQEHPWGAFFAKRRPINGTGVVTCDIDRLFVQACQVPSDIFQHLPLLRKLASECNSVTEFGTRRGVSTIALIAGRPQSVTCVDLVRFPEIDTLEQAARAADVRFQFDLRSTIDSNFVIAETDFLFIDTLHTWEQLRTELQLHSERVKRFLAFHDVTTFGLCNETSVTGQANGGLLPAILEFLAASPDSWRVKFYRRENNGLLVLERT